MDKADLLSLWQYNQWANARVLQAAAQVTAAQFSAPANLSHGSLQGTLVHLVAVEQIWRQRFQADIAPVALPTAADFPTLASLSARWQNETAAMQGFIHSLPDGAVQQVVTYTTFTGVSHTDPLWQLLMHVMNHSMQFRSEAGIALTSYHHSPGDLDLLVYLRERQ